MLFSHHSNDQRQSRCLKSHRHQSHHHQNHRRRSRPRNHHQNRHHRNHLRNRLRLQSHLQTHLHLQKYLSPEHLPLQPVLPLNMSLQDWHLLQLLPDLQSHSQTPHPSRSFQYLHHLLNQFHIHHTAHLIPHFCCGVSLLIQLKSQSK